MDQKPELKQEREDQDKRGTMDMMDLTGGGEEPIQEEGSVQEKQIVMEEGIMHLTKEEEIMHLTKEDIGLPKEDLTKEVIDLTGEIIGWEEHLMWSRDSDLN